MAIAVKAKTVEDVKLGLDKLHTSHKQMNRIEEIFAEIPCCRGSDARMKCEGLQPNAVAGYCVWSKAGYAVTCASDMCLVKL